MICAKFQKNRTVFRGGSSPFYVYMYFQWAKQLIFAIWAYSLIFASNNIFVVFIVFVDHENIGKELKSMVLSCTVQKLWVRVISQNMTKYAYLGVLHIPITFEPLMIEPWILALYLCFHGLQTQ